MIQKSVGANVSTRLIQLHMCIVYLFAALGKLQGETWWTGEALWGALANYEYQTIDMTWTAEYPMFIDLLTHITVLWVRTAPVRRHREPNDVTRRGPSSEARTP